MYSTTKQPLSVSLSLVSHWLSDFIIWSDHYHEHYDYPYGYGHHWVWVNLSETHSDWEWEWLPPLSVRTESLLPTSASFSPIASNGDMCVTHLYVGHHQVSLSHPQWHLQSLAVYHLSYVTVRLKFFPGLVLSHADTQSQSVNVSAVRWVSHLTSVYVCVSVNH